jgi:Asp-tRNA(Asn)/Glu-tRNA(Gln) amidotransferase C subunit
LKHASEYFQHPTHWQERLGLQHHSTGGKRSWNTLISRIRTSSGLPVRTEDGRYEILIADLGRFIYNNYRQALDRIRENSPLLNSLLSRNSLREDAIERWLEDERDYLENPPQANDGIAQSVEYLKLLQKLQKAV